MGKKKEKKGGFKQDISIVERRRMYMETVIGEAIILGVITFYFIGSIIAYAAYFKKGIDFSAVLETIKNNPIFMIAVIVEEPKTAGAIIGGSLFAVLMAELFVLISYYFNRARIHSDLDTLKGSTVWQNAKEVSARYADVAEDEPKVKKSLFQTIVDSLKASPKKQKKAK